MTAQGVRPRIKKSPKTGQEDEKAFGENWGKWVGAVRENGEKPPKTSKKRGKTAVLPRFSGGRSGTRTLGPLIKSQLLYQLS